MICKNCLNSFHIKTRTNELQHCLISKEISMYNTFDKCDVKDCSHFDAITAPQKPKDVLYLKLIMLTEKMEKWIDRQEYNDRKFSEEIEKLNEHISENVHENLFNHNED